MNIEIKATRDSDLEVIEWEFGADRKEAARVWKQLKRTGRAPDTGAKLRSAKMVVDGNGFDSWGRGF